VLPVAVLCGGRGTRLRGVTGDDVPKALVPVAGRPFLDHKLDGLAAAGFTDVVLLVGHRGDRIDAHVGNGSRYALSVRVVDDGGELLGTGGAVQRALAVLPDAFWVTYGDSLLDFDVTAAEARFAASGALGLMTVLRNHDRYGPSNVVLDGAGDGARVAAYAKDPVPRGADCIDYGMLILTGAAFDPPTPVPFDLAAVVGPLAARGALAAFEVARRFHDIGTPEAFAETEAFLRADGR
jgi:N-acetyl-alpha-D-muramate 1-phosphate uridylyltransferase